MYAINAEKTLNIVGLTASCFDSNTDIFKCDETQSLKPFADSAKLVIILSAFAGWFRFDS